MNFLWGATYGLASPTVLAIAAPLVLGSIVYAYLRRGSGKRYTVPTLFLLKALQGAPRSRQKFFPPLRFFFELALLTLLILGGAGLYQIGSGDKIAVVIDNSLSVSANTGAVIGDKSLLESELSMTRDLFNELPSNSEVELFVSSPNLHSLTGELVSIPSAEKLLEGITPSYSTDKLSEVSQKFIVDTKYDKIILLTDKSRSDTAFLNSNLEQRVSVRNVRQQIKEDINNIAISNISFKSDNFGAKSRTLTVSVDAYSKSEVSVKLILKACYSTDLCKSFSSLEDKLIKLSAKATSLIEFKNLPEKYDIFSVELQSREGDRSDSIALDNKAFLTLDSKQSRSAVISDLGIKELGLNLVEAVKFEKIAPSDYEKSLAYIKEGEYSSLIFHRYVPSQLPKSNSIFVMPPPGNLLIKSGKEIRGSEITRWDVSNPLLSYLNVPGLSFKLLTPLEKPDWASDIIYTTHGSALAAGQSGNYRYAIFGFEIFPYEGRETPIVSILTLNALKWISDFSSTIGYREVSSSIDISPDFVSVGYLDGEELFKGEDNGIQSPEKISITKPGLVIIKKREGTGSIIAFNFLSREESDTLNPGSIAINQETLPNQDLLENQKSLILLLAKIVFALIILDLIFLLITSLINFVSHKKQARYGYGS